MQCIGCNTKDCGVCPNCKNMKRYGGPGKKKKGCIKRACLGTKNTIVSSLSIIME